MNPTANKSDFEDLTTNLKRLSLFIFRKIQPIKTTIKSTFIKKIFN